MNPASTTKAIVLDADVYDTLELVALAYGGIGAGEWFKGDGMRNDDDAVPCCVHGMAMLAIGYTSEFEPASHAFVLEEALGDAGIKYNNNDRAVRNINMRRGRATMSTPAFALARVPFAEWCAELNVVRGPHYMAPADDATWPEVAS